MEQLIENQETVLKRAQEILTLLNMAGPVSVETAFKVVCAFKLGCIHGTQEVIDKLRGKEP